MASDGRRGRARAGVAGGADSGAYAARAASTNITATVQRYIAGERDDTMSRIVFPDLAEADRIFARMGQRGLYCWLAGPASPVRDTSAPPPEAARACRNPPAR
jgi:hypothetical protein